jgi:hypothetical protein
VLRVCAAPVVSLLTQKGVTLASAQLLRARAILLCHNEIAGRSGVWAGTTRLYGIITANRVRQERGTGSSVRDAAADAVRKLEEP